MQAGANARQKSGSKSKAAQAAPAEETLRATQVLGRRVIDGSNALILGYVDEIYFSFETRQMVALRVRAYFKARLLALLKGHKSQWVVPMQIVRKIGAYAVVIDRERAGAPHRPGAAHRNRKKVALAAKTTCRFGQPARAGWPKSRQRRWGTARQAQRCAGPSDDQPMTRV